MSHQFESLVVGIVAIKFFQRAKSIMGAFGWGRALTCWGAWSFVLVVVPFPDMRNKMWSEEKE